MYANMYKYAKVVLRAWIVYIVRIGDEFEFIFPVIVLQKACFWFFN